jgi:hypothetical protein
VVEESQYLLLGQKMGRGMALGVKVRWQCLSRPVTRDEGLRTRLRGKEPMMLYKRSPSLWLEDGRALLGYVSKRFAPRCFHIP